MDTVAPRAVELDVEVIRALAPDAARQLSLLPPVDAAWQPSDYLPDFSREGWTEQLASLREQAQALPDDLIVVLVGDLVTEEALPSYSMALNHLVHELEGTNPDPWARWLRGWTAEENRHGDLLNGYLRLSGRVDMRAVERTVQTLLTNGFNPQTGADPYNLLVYTSFQERATRISHGNVGKLAASSGDASLGRMCRLIAGDEARHETFYTRMMSRVLDMDPEGGILAFATMLDRQIAMPGRFMDDGREPGLFEHFATVAQRIGVYTAHDYAAIVDHLVTTWDIAGRSVSGDAARAQDRLCHVAARYARLADRMSARLRQRTPIPFAWIQNRTA